MKKIWKQMKRVTSGERPLIDVWYYLQGNYRYKLYYNDYLVFLLRGHIKEQIKFRINVMNAACYERGECIKCGCQTTMLQMCNKTCEGYCYPPMMTKKDWIRFKQGYQCCNWNDSYIWLYRDNGVETYKLADDKNGYDLIYKK